MNAWVYILANRKHGTLYIGVTSRLAERIYKHRTDPTGFVRQFNVRMLVWYEEHCDIAKAIQRETSLKRWKRDWKIELLETQNPDWRDLYLDLNA